MTAITEAVSAAKSRPQFRVRLSPPFAKLDPTQHGE